MSNDNNFPNISGLSILNEANKELINDLNIIIDDLGNEFAPIILQELHNRLEFIINNFNNELNQLIKKSFKSHHTIYNQLNTMIYTKKTSLLTNKNIAKKNKTDDSIPSYLQGLGLENEKHTR
tara:strand:- start:730 stop:1098 length:369 start_codon:yes stop_codon:yes gene_type:complete